MADTNPAEPRSLATLDACVEQSLAIDEPIAGTATAPVTSWLLLQYQKRWERKIESTPLPESVRTWLHEAQACHPGMRVQFIRNDQDSDLAQTRMYVAEPGNARHLRRFEFQNLLELSEVDPASLLKTVLQKTDGSQLHSTPAPPLYLVCTHGRRDRCCAQRGISLLQALQSCVDEEEVWHCSHLGGHRFAPTALYLPQGILYGRLRDEDVEAMVQAHRQNRLYDLNYYRGNCALMPAAQAAEAWLRQRHGYASLGALTLTATADDDQGARLCFQSTSGVEHRLRVTREVLPKKRRSSCEAAEPTHAYRHQISEEVAVSQTSESN